MNGALYPIRAEELQRRKLGQPTQLIVDSQLYAGREHGTKGIVTVKSRYQRTSSEDTAGW
jgi:hypothetical protein